MASRLSKDPRLDPRIRAMFGDYPPPPDDGDFANREEILAFEASDTANRRAEALKTMLETLDSEALAPSSGLEFRKETIASHPDRNTIDLYVTRPKTDEALACVYYIHGGGMAHLSCTYGNYRSWARLIAAQGVAVVMVEFRNSLRASTVAGVGPFPAGLNDCVSGLLWVHDNARDLRIDPARIIVSGESGGGNLTLASGLKLKRMGEVSRVKGLYALCPYLAGVYPQARYPSTIENNGYLIDLYSGRSVIAYGIEELHNRNPLAWPGFATSADVAGLPPVVISVNECDPLRDEGIDFYRLLLASGVRARCRQIMGTIHAIEVLLNCCPDISRAAAADIAHFAQA